ncbi:hypothetical protein GX563_03830 [Candidatus Bathyarchaeota archaeon]|mgnify:CR=1 FL=1|nr:hypothetical protein [Candidatus Bathyarchaeota archaeon]
MEQKPFTPLKVGILIAALTYFLFTLHATFVLSWIGEWEPLMEPIRSWILVTDVTAYIFLIFRFIAGILAVTTAVLYFVKKLTQNGLYKMARLVIVFEGLYWIGLLPSGIWGLVPTAYGNLRIPGTDLGFSSSLLLSTGIPCTVASIAVPISLFLLAWKLSPNKPQRPAIKWATVAGFFVVLSLWLNNSGMWIITAMTEGMSYVTKSPEYLTSFIVTVGGLLALASFTAYYAKKTSKAENIAHVNLRTAGVIILGLGLYFLWNYLTWVMFAGANWNEWYAWVLGHNLDLWMLSLPLVGLPLLFYSRPSSDTEKTV